jgi:Ca2+/Na+ antiporter
MRLPRDGQIAIGVVLGSAFWIVVLVLLWRWL